MKILRARYILLCDNDFTVLQDSSIAFDEKIVEVGDFSVLYNKYKNAKIYDFQNDIAMPAFVNTHVHLEFSANLTSLYYGDFIKWVRSIIENRENLLKNATKTVQQHAINVMKQSGIATIGAISSFGLDMEVCSNSDMKVVYFNEILGVNDTSENWDKFIYRFNRSKELKTAKFQPALSVHSPYSTCPQILSKALDFARDNSIVVSTHFLESEYEKRWLNSTSSEFYQWLKNFSPKPTPFYSESEFVEYFKGIDTIFTHCVFVDDFNMFDKEHHHISHCAFSNLLLSKKGLAIKDVVDNNLNLTIGTDGLSSNISLNFFDELRANLFLMREDLPNFAKKLIICATANGAKALKTNNGMIDIGKDADIVVFNGFDLLDIDQLALELILQTKKCKKIFIQGEPCDLS